MATGQGIKHQIPVIPDTKCELCEENEIQWKCFTCTRHQHMCNACAKGHLKSEYTQNHRVTSMKDSEKQFNQQQDDSAKCTLHPTEDVQIQCKPCDTPICRDCLTSGSHQHHKLVKFDDIMESKHREFKDLSAENDRIFALYEGNITQTKKLQEDFTKEIKHRTEEIKARNTKLKAKLDQFTDHAITQLKQKEKQTLQSLKSKQKDLETDKKEIKKLADESKEKLSHRTIKMIQFTTTLKQELEKYKSYEPLQPTKCPDFVYQEVDDKKLMEIFGQINITSQNVPKVPQKPETVDITPIIDVKVIQSFNIEDKSILVPASDDQVWMVECGSSDISLVTINGDVVQTVNTDFDVRDLAVTKSGDLLATVNDGNKVKKLKSDNTFTDLYTASTNYETYGITVTDNNNIVVCLNDKHEKEDQLVELSSSGQEINTIKCQQDSKTPFFKAPTLVSSNRNGDLIVVQNNNIVVVVDKDHNKRFTYKGHTEGLKAPFDPQYTVTDQYGNILICDCDNSAIHILDKDGSFIHYIRSDEHGVEGPLGIRIDRHGRLWICGDDKVLIIKYI